MVRLCLLATPGHVPPVKQDTGQLHQLLSEGASMDQYKKIYEANFHFLKNAVIKSPSSQSPMDVKEDLAIFNRLLGANFGYRSNIDKKWVLHSSEGFILWLNIYLCCDWVNARALPAWWHICMQCRCKAEIRLSLVEKCQDTASCAHCAQRNLQHRSGRHIYMFKKKVGLSCGFQMLNGDQNGAHFFRKSLRKDQ